MKRIIDCSIILLILSALSILAQNQRYKDEIFSSYQLQSNVIYGTGSKNVLDIYTGTGDAAANRPLVIFIHGGGFKDGDKVSNFGTRVCGGLAKRGYVVASINYRLTSTQATDQQSFEAMIRALQDSKAAVRFFRKNASLYGVDTSQIFATGSSAGSITALHMAYLNASEVPSFVVDPTLKDLEGTSGNPGYSSKVHGVISNWGAIGDTAWIKKGDVPVYCVHGVADSTVYFTKIPADGPFKYSSKYISTAAQRNSITNGLRIFNNTGHTLDNNAVKQDSAIQDFSKWLFQIIKIPSDVIKQGKIELPDFPFLFQNYPNPFNPNTVIEFYLPKDTDVRLAIYDSIGNTINSYKEQFVGDGIFTKTFDGTKLASGVYFYQLITDKTVLTKKMVLMK